MNRAMKRRIEAMESKYSDELRYFVTKATLSSLNTILEGISEDLYEVLRENRVGTERAGRITNQAIDRMVKKVNE